jgi:lipopolysaccharide biosynthesis protein
VADSLKKQAIKGVVWSAVERFSVQGIQFVLSIVIARLVSPSEYGLIAMLNIFLAIGQTFIDGGFSNALVQKKERTEADFSTVFLFNIVFALFIYCILWLSSPLIASFYDVPTLEILTKVVGLNLIISSLSIVHRTKLIISLNFKAQARISLLAVIVSGAVGILLAWKGYGVWALAIQSVLNNLLISIALFCMSRWKIHWYFSKKSFGDLFSFGSKLLIGSLFHTIYSNLYTVIIGRCFQSATVGLFNRASTFSSFFSTNITDVISRAMYPVLCEIQDEEQRLRDVFLSYLRQAAYIIFPIAVLLSVLSKPFISVLLTDRWSEAATYMSILCIANMWNPVMYINWQILNVRGRSDLSLKSEIIKKLVAFSILFVTIPFGVDVMCWGVLVYSICDIAIVISFVKKIFPVTYRDEIKSLFPVIILNLLLGIGVYWFVRLFQSPFLQLFLGISVGVLFYLFVSYLFRFREFLFLKNSIERFATNKE